MVDELPNLKNYIPNPLPPNWYQNQGSYSRQIEPKTLIAGNKMFVYCPTCGTWVRNKLFFGTLHICD